MGGGGLGCGARVGAFNKELLLALPRGSARLAPAFIGCTSRTRARTRVDVHANTHVATQVLPQTRTCVCTYMDVPIQACTHKYHTHVHRHVQTTLCTRAR